MTNEAEVSHTHPNNESEPQSPVSASTTYSFNRSRSRPHIAKRFIGLCCMPTRVCFNCCAYPCTRCVRGSPKRPTWNNKTELAISTLRTASNGVPRDAKSLRFWTDRAIPDLILPKEAVREKVVPKLGNHEIKCEWVWPRKIATDHLPKKSHHKVKHFINKEWVASQTVPVVLYLHGGAFCLCNSATHRGLVYSLSIELNAIVFVPNYRRPPEVTAKDAVEDCFNAYKYMIEDFGIDPKRICLMGDSAGGALVGLTLVKIRDNLPISKVPRCGVMLSPWVDFADEDIEAKAHSGGPQLPPYDFLPYDLISLFASESAGPFEMTDPEVNISRAKLDGLPPLYINFGEVEVLRPQIEKFIQKCKDSNLQIEEHMLPDMIHVGQMLSSVSPAGAEATKKVAEYINRQMVN